MEERHHVQPPRTPLARYASNFAIAMLLTVHVIQPLALWLLVDRTSAAWSSTNLVAPWHSSFVVKQGWLYLVLKDHQVRPGPAASPAHCCL